LSKADSLNPTCLAAPAAVRPFFTKRANSVTKAVIAGVQRGPLIFGSGLWRVFRMRRIVAAQWALTLHSQCVRCFASEVGVPMNPHARTSEVHPPVTRWSSCVASTRDWQFEFHTGRRGRSTVGSPFRRRVVVPKAGESVAPLIMQGGIRPQHWQYARDQLEFS
jgi:hypothetical protein